MKSNVKLIALFCFITALCCLIIILRGKTEAKGKTAVIKLGDEVIKTVNLSAVKEPYEFTVSTGDGGYNTIRVEQGKIGVTDADCPDKTCVRQGFISDSRFPVVCLPHRLSVTVSEAADIDAVTGGR